MTMTIIAMTAYGIESRYSDTFQERCLCRFSNQGRSNLSNDDKDEFHNLALKPCSGVAKSEKSTTVVPFNKTNTQRLLEGDCSCN